MWFSYIIIVKWKIIFILIIKFFNGYLSIFVTRIEIIYFTMLSTNERVVFYIYPKIIHGDLLNLHDLEQFKLPLVLNKIIKFCNSWNFFEFWAKKLYKFCKMTSNQCIRSKAKRIMARLGLWTKQWTPFINKATFIWIALWHLFNGLETCYYHHTPWSPTSFPIPPTLDHQSQPNI